MKNLLLIVITILFIFSTPLSSQANNCSLCGKKVYIGNQCVGCTFNQFIGKISHPCKKCGQNIFFGKICRSCKEKQADSQKMDAISAEKASKNNYIENSKANVEAVEKKPSGGANIFKSITSSTNNFFRRIFGSNKHD